MRSTRNHRTSSRSRHHAVRYQFGVTPTTASGSTTRSVAWPDRSTYRRRTTRRSTIACSTARGTGARRSSGASNNRTRAPQLARRLRVGLTHRRHDLRERGAGSRRERRRRRGLEPHGDRRRFGRGEVDGRQRARRVQDVAAAPARSPRRSATPASCNASTSRSTVRVDTSNRSASFDALTARGLRARSSSTIAYRRSVRFIAGAASGRGPTPAIARDRRP